VSDGIVIAGGGLAAQRCTETLRSQGYDGPIRIVCAEPHPPYDRPPLSKELLTGALPADAVALRPRAWYEERSIDLLLGARAVGLHTARRRLELERGARLHYDALLIATGSRARLLPALEGYENVSVLRTLDDALALRRALAPGSRLAVVGAGFIGLEAASSALKLGAEVTIIEALGAPLAEVLGAELGRWFADLHRAEGANVLLGTHVERAHGGRRVRALELACGRRVACDHVLVGVGVAPDTGWLPSALADAGVPVDPDGRTAVEGIFAAGDAALVYDPGAARHLRTDHWEAAARQGAAAARAMLGLEPVRVRLPSFWSDQHGIRIQYVGRAGDADRVNIDGDPDARDFEALFTRAGVPVAALLVGRPRSLADARRRVQAGLDSMTPEEEKQR
jgi:3-phenylpropionate/trans-cinnamate dioxygenase ferredoxin reductase component